MPNLTSSSFSYFILTAYSNLGNLAYVCFLITALVYIFILVVNTCLIVVICVNRSLHEPMYLFLCSLFVNELFGSTGLFPFLLIQILSDIHTVSVPLCCLQIFCLYTYGSIEFLNLALMSYDRYLAICCPLQYHTSMTSKNVVVLVIVVWLGCSLKLVIFVSLNMNFSLCGNTMNALYCNNNLIIKLACSDTTVNDIYGLLGSVVSMFITLLLILFSYIKILKVCFSGSAQTRRKAVSTCTPQLVSLLNFAFGCCFEILHSKFDMSGSPSVLRILLSLYFFIIQPLLNPIMYGMQMSKIRKICKDVFCYKTMSGQTDVIEVQ